MGSGCEASTGELKKKLISALHGNQEEACLEIEDTEKELDEKFEFDVRKEWDDVEETKRNLGKKK